MSREVRITDHAIARFVERVPRFNGMPMDVMRAAMGAAVRVGTDRGGRAILASPSLASVYLIVAEEPDARVVVTVVPRYDARAAGRKALVDLSELETTPPPSPDPEVAALRAANEVLAAKLRESEERRRVEVALLQRERDRARNELAAERSRAA
jgi:hypothetical protein